MFESFEGVFLGQGEHVQSAVESDARYRVGGIQGRIGTAGTVAHPEFGRRMELDFGFALSLLLERSYWGVVESNIRKGVGSERAVRLSES